MRLIDADAIPFRREIGDLSECPKMFVSKNTVDHLPTIDPESLRPKGEWIVTECDSGETEGYPAFIEFRCPFCNEPYSLESGEYNWYYGDEAIPFNFCHNCAADMRGNADDG